MLGPPPSNGIPDDRDIREGEDREDGGDSGTLLGLGDRGPQHQITAVKQDANQGGGQTGIPGPPNTPDNACPYHAGDQTDAKKVQPDFGYGDGELVIAKL